MTHGVIVFSQSKHVVACVCLCQCLCAYTRTFLAMCKHSNTHPCLSMCTRTNTHLCPWGYALVSVLCVFVFLVCLRGQITSARTTNVLSTTPLTISPSCPPIPPHHHLQHQFPKTGRYPHYFKHLCNVPGFCKRKGVPRKAENRKGGYVSISRAWMCSTGPQRPVFSAAKRQRRRLSVQGLCHNWAAPEPRQQHRHAIPVCWWLSGRCCTVMLVWEGVLV